MARLTMEHLLRPALAQRIAETQYYFCETPNCPVVYFSHHPGAPVFRKQDLSVRMGSKETGDPIPLCYCFSITRQAVRDEIQQTGFSTVVSRIKAEVQAGNCACEVKNPSGKCCLGNVTRVVQQGLQTIRPLAGAGKK